MKKFGKIEAGLTLLIVAVLVYIAGLLFYVGMKPDTAVVLAITGVVLAGIGAVLYVVGFKEFANLK